MKKNIINFGVAAFLLLLFAGCAPQLAQTKYGNVENQWKNYVQKSYKDWSPPPTPPPIVNTVDGTSNSFSVDIVPDPVVDNNLTTSGINSTNETVTLPNDIATSGTTESYTVKKGDTLWSIACKFYDNDGTKWKKLQEANKDVLPSPGKIKPGLVLTIPAK